MCPSKIKRIPIIDMGLIGLGCEPTKEEWQRFGKEICTAFSDIGFLYLRGHGINLDLVADVETTSNKFFSLDENIKNRFARGITDIQGFTPPNREKLTVDANRHEIRESYDVTSMDGKFPDEIVPALRPAVKALADSFISLSSRILEAMAVGLDLERNFFTSTHKELCGKNNATCLRLLHYPPVPPNIPEGSIRCGSHTDYGTLTLLFQDTMGGLEVRDRNDEWVEATPVKGTILVNVGDILQFWTSDKLKATVHRVLIPSEETKARVTRRSTVFFVHPDDSVLIKPLDGSEQYQPITAKEHVMKRFQETYQY
ncbi:unnamed protein product [Meganyctiphanes norvegica]|uniref:Fe2OG dioxygenase domain-containing protein n=1 Tax=Meganyctiphanes norvegica TaxID=48144 RepID=A0AAV2S5L2_MEGNR